MRASRPAPSDRGQGEPRSGRATGGERAAGGFARLADHALEQRVQEAEEAERERRPPPPRPPRLAGRDAAEQDQQLGDEQRRRRQAAERAEADAHRRGRRPARGGDARGRLARGLGVVAQQRQRRVEAERLGEPVAGDVDDHAGDRQRGAEADAERDDPHVLEARVGEQALPRQRPPEERDRDDQRGQAEADEERAGGRAADAGVERRLHAPGDQHDRRQQRRGQQRADRRRRLAVGVGQPVVHRRPADLRRQPGEDQHERDQRRLRAAGRRRWPPARASRARPGPRCRWRDSASGEHDDPEQRDRQARAS